MPWTYKQKTGELVSPSNGVVGTGYSGKGMDKNNPDSEFKIGLGPIPVGWYTIKKPPFSSPTHGPFVLRLIPDPTDDMEGRAGFLIHGDSIRVPGTASEGCIIQNRIVRGLVNDSPDDRLQVVTGL